MVLDTSSGIHGLVFASDHSKAVLTRFLSLAEAPPQDLTTYDQSGNYPSMASLPHGSSAQAGR